MRDDQRRRMQMLEATDDEWLRRVESEEAESAESEAAVCAICESAETAAAVPGQKAASASEVKKQRIGPSPFSPPEQQREVQKS